MGVRHLIGLVTATSLLALGAAAPGAYADAIPAASGTKTIYDFPGDFGGEYPDTDLVADAAGSLYGTTVLGGTGGTGTVFVLKHTRGGWKHSVLYGFAGGMDGGQPYGGVTLDAQGNLFGATVVGGTGGACPEDGCGVIYELTKSDRGHWKQIVIHDFNGADGSGPGAGLSLGPQGDLFGMTPTGGAYGFGVVYRLHPNGDGSWDFAVIHDFTGGADGAGGSKGRLLPDATGHLYGVATAGGTNGNGVAFKLTRRQSGAWKLIPLYEFKGEPDAGFPYGALSFGPDGALYGTTYYDGQFDLGSVYRLTHAGGSWSEQVLYSFAGGTDGSGSISNVLFDQAGNLYGTTSEGGDPSCGCGVIFRLSPQQDGSWVETVMHAFTGAPDDGASAYDGMVGGSNGAFFGATVHGGDDDEGAVYRFSP